MDGESMEAGSNHGSVAHLSEVNQESITSRGTAPKLIGRLFGEDVSRFFFLFVCLGFFWIRKQIVDCGLSEDVHALFCVTSAGGGLTQRCPDDKT